MYIVLLILVILVVPVVLVILQNLVGKRKEVCLVVGLCAVLQLAS